MGIINNLFRTAGRIGYAVSKDTPVYRVWHREANIVETIEGGDHCPADLVVRGEASFDRSVMIARTKERYGVTWKDETAGWCLLMVENDSLIFRIVGSSCEGELGILLGDGIKRVVETPKDEVEASWQFMSFWDLPEVFEQVFGISLSKNTLKKCYISYKHNNIAEGKVKLPVHSVKRGSRA